MLFLYCKILFVTNPLCIWLTLEAEILNGYRESECDCSRHPNTDYSQLLLAYTNSFNTFSWSCYSDVLGILYQFRWIWFYNICILCLCSPTYIFEWFILWYMYEQCFYFRIKSWMASQYLIRFLYVNFWIFANACLLSTHVYPIGLIYALW